MAGNHSDQQQRRSMRPYRACLLLVFCAITGACQEFFPKGLLYPDNATVDSSLIKWYSGYLTVLNEPSLFEASHDPVARSLLEASHAPVAQSYRFLWLRSFHHPVAIRVLIHPDGTGTLVTKVADGAGGYKPGKLMVDKTTSLTSDQVKRLGEKIQQLGYWTLPMRDPNPLGLDGAQWVIEGVDQGRYRVINRWSPRKGPARELGLHFLHDLARLKEEPIY